MITHARLASVTVAALIAAPGLAQDQSRAFGQLEPGQSVVEITQGEPPADTMWRPVQVGPRLDEASRTDPIPNIPPPGGFVSLEDLAARQAEADEASRRQARALAESLRTVTASGPDSEEPAPVASGVGETASAGTEPGLGLPVAPETSGGASVDRAGVGGSGLGYSGVSGPVAAGGGGTPPALFTGETGRSLGQPDGGEAPAGEPGRGNPITSWFDGQGAAVQTMLALGLVILLIYSLAWVYRKLSVNRGGVTGINSGKAPAGILEVLGRYPLGGKQSLVLLKFDQRILLLSQSATAKGGSEMTTLCELDRPEDVASVLVKVRDAEGTSINKSFRAAMHKAELQGQVAVRPPEPASRAVEPKPRPADRSDVLPGHHDPFAGMGGKPVRGAPANGAPEADRAELWGEESPNDPVAALRKRLDALRNQQSGAQPVARRSPAKSTSTQEWIT
ncbi:MAG: FliO/MopB family protein [Phycisphaerales bacterium JB040]